MRIGVLLDTDRALPEIVATARELAGAGLASTWATQIFGHDALTVLAVVGSQVEGIDLGTGVVPVYPRHPQMLASQALSVQQACGGRLTVGIGLSHQVVVEGMWGYRYERPARFMRQYLEALVPLLSGEAVEVRGDLVHAVGGPLEVSVPSPPDVVVAALGPTMLKVAGELAHGTVTWMTGISTIGSHIAPSITEAARRAGRPTPRVVCMLPVTVTSERERALERVDRAFALYPSLPSYAAMLEREGASRPSDIALVGRDDEVVGHLERLAQAGATDFVGAILGTPDEQRVTRSLLADLARQGGVSG